MLDVIPAPASVQLHSGFLPLSQTVAVHADPAAAAEAATLEHDLPAVLGAGAAPRAQLIADHPTPVRLSLQPTIASDEGYLLRISSEGIDLSAPTNTGLFRGGRTIVQLIAAALSRAADGPPKLRAADIEDRPRFAWRGLMLDVSRHFFSADQVCRLIDLMALYKFNTFHWHLTDDQGWRMPVRKYPRLTEIGAWRQCTLVGPDSARPRRYDDVRYGGCYATNDIRRVIAHAAARHITIVPEIDMPGHMQAAVAAYPQFGNTGAPVEVRCHWNISQHILNPLPHTVAFAQDVLDEVIELFPGRYIHVGGDEAVKHQWSESRAAQDRMRELGLSSENQMQSWFIGQMAQFISGRGRKAIGWDEILEGGLPADAAVMSWRGTAGGIAAARLGHEVIMAPTSHTYFDYYQAAPEREPLAIGGLTTLEKVYDFDPVPPELPAEFHRHILGGQGQLWTEYIGTMEYLEYMAFPRAAALAETLWTAPRPRDWKDFRDRLDVQRHMLDRLGVHYGPIPD